MKKIMFGSVLALSLFVGSGIYTPLIVSAATEESDSVSSTDTRIELSDGSFLVLKDYVGTEGVDFVVNQIIEQPDGNLTRAVGAYYLSTSTTITYYTSNYPSQVYREVSKNMSGKIWLYAGNIPLKSVQSGGTHGGYNCHYASKIPRIR